MSNRLARFLLLFVAFWLPVQTMAAMSMPLCRHAQEQAMTGIEAEPSAAAVHCHETMAADQPANDTACDNCEICHMACASFMPSATQAPGVIAMAGSYVALPVTAPPSHIAEPPQHPPRHAA